jgi:hypothetical protein
MRGAEGAMSDRRVDLANGRPPSDGWAVASLVILLGVVLASKYLFPERGQGPFQLRW